jgi:hypothetical protein
MVNVKFKMKILRPFTGTGAVFFPIGLPPNGTCEDATKRCIAQCYATGKKYSNYDVEILIPEKEKWWIYKQFMTRNIRWLKNEIIRELDGLQTPILHWFASGDVLTKDMDRISMIIKYLGNDVEQIGFTRNVEFWKRHKGIFALTVESKTEAKMIDSNGFFSMPNYRKQETVMYSPSSSVRGGFCGPLSCDDESNAELNHYINCRACRMLQTGCFDKAHSRLRNR